MRRCLLILPLLLLTAPAVAHAGGFATTGLSSTPDGLRAGQPWKVELTILQHGRTPLSDLSPEIVAIDADGNRTTFRAKPTGEPGRYAATVRFPKPGQWSYVVYDGFNNAMPTTYPGGPDPRSASRADDGAPPRPRRPARAADRARRRAPGRRPRAVARAPSPAPARPPGLKAVTALLAALALAGCGNEDEERRVPARAEGRPRAEGLGGAGLRLVPHLRAARARRRRSARTSANSLGGRSRDYIRESIVAAQREGLRRRDEHHARGLREADVEGRARRARRVHREGRALPLTTWCSGRPAR